MPPKIRSLMIMLIVAVVCQIAVPGIAIGMVVSRHDQIDATGQQLMTFLLVLEGIAITCGITATVLLARRHRAAPVFAWIHLIGLLPLAMLGLVLGGLLVSKLVSQDLRKYLQEA